jgi:hypothetical protein
MSSLGALHFPRVLCPALREHHIGSHLPERKNSISIYDTASLFEGTALPG